MAKQSSGFNIKDLVQKSEGKPTAKKPAAKKKTPKPAAGGGDVIGQPTPPMPSGMGMGMTGGY